VAIKQSLYWPSWDAIRNKRHVNTLLGLNEPDHLNKHNTNISVMTAINMWPQMLQTGFRLGSPAATTPNHWLDRFMEIADSLNLRVNFLVFHAYWAGKVNGGHADAWYNALRNAYKNYGKRPLWITEWNNGANWTKEHWPPNIHDAMAKQAKELPLILQVFDTTSFVQRYSIFNWVKKKRAVIVADTLTPAGKEYAADKSKLAYTSAPNVYHPADMHKHTFRMVAPIMKYSLNKDYKYKPKLSWLDLNGDLASEYVIERKSKGETKYKKIGTLKFKKDYDGGSTVSFTDSTFNSTSNYRMYSVSYNYKDTSWYSRTLNVKADAEPTPPDSVSGKIISSKKVKLNWMPVEQAHGYNVKRSLNKNGPFKTILANTKSLKYTDDSLQHATSYYYVVTSFNSSGESKQSKVIRAVFK
jgi:hypothetical protein